LKDSIRHVLSESPGRAAADSVVLGEVKDLGGEKRKVKMLFVVERVLDE
jgi:hypothetical protein